MHVRIVLMALLIAAAAYFVVIVPSIEGSEKRVVPRTEEGIYPPSFTRAWRSTQR